MSNSKDQWDFMRLYEESYESSNDFALWSLFQVLVEHYYWDMEKVEKMLVILGIECHKSQQMGSD